MASAFAHAFAAVSLGAVVTPGRVAPRLLVVGVACTLLPDLDVIGLRFGIDYGALLGHRGLSHSLAFAALLAVLATAVFFREAAWKPIRFRIGLYLFVATASHGLFDAMTNGGLGIAFFSPFDLTRYFLPIRPVEVSPIGVRSFFTARSLPLRWSELLYIALPWTLLVALVAALVRRSSKRG
jgi:inner membrane protein